MDLGQIIQILHPILTVHGYHHEYEDSRSATYRFNHGLTKTPKTNERTYIDVYTEAVHIWRYSNHGIGTPERGHTVIYTSHPDFFTLLNQALACDHNHQTK